MSACPRCGFGNPPAAAVCENPDCRADLRPSAADGPLLGDGRSGSGRHPAPGGTAPTVAVPDTGAYRAAPSHAEPYRRPPTDPRRPGPPYHPGPAPGGVPSGGAEVGGVPSGGAEQRAGLRLTAEPLDLRAEPGGSASLTVTVRNRGTQVEHFSLAVNGPIAALARVEPPTLQVYPDAEETAQVFFTIPRAPHPIAGRAPFQVVARGHVHHDVADRAAGTVTIGRFDQITAALEPEMTRGRKPGRHRLTVLNLGNAPLRVDIALSDQQGELTFDPPRIVDRLEAGARLDRPVLVGAPVKWFGRTQVHNFTGAVTGDAPGTTASVQGRRRQVPRFPWWIPTAAVAILALVIALLAILPKPKVPAVFGQDRPTAEKTLSDKGYKPVAIEQPNDTVPAGSAVNTDPAAGQQFAKGQPVKLFVSVGPCKGPCPIGVPDVHGLALAAATDALTTAGFAVDRTVPVADPTVPAGQVISTSPAANTKADPGTKIVVNASSGPAAGPSTAPAPNGGPSAAPAPAPPSNANANAPATVPASLAGMSAAAATAALQKLGVTVVSTHVHTNKAPLDTVLSTSPAAGGTAAPGSTVTLQLAQPTAPIDLLATAQAATWSDNAGALTFTFPTAAVTGPPPPVPRALVTPLGPTDLLEDGSPGPALATEPPASATLPPAEITGEFSLAQPIIAGDHLRASVGLRDPTAVGGDVDVIVRVPGGTPLFKERKFRDGKLLNLDVDLTPAVGATAVQIEVDARVAADNRVGWKNLRLEGQVG